MKRQMRVVLATLLAAGCVGPRARTPSEPKGPSLQVLAEGPRDALERAVQKGVPVDAHDDSGRTALFFAAQRNRTNNVQVLLAAGADPNHLDHDGATPLTWAARSGAHQAMCALIMAGASPFEGSLQGLPDAYWAAASGSTDAVDVLFQGRERGGLLLDGVAGAFYGAIQTCNPVIALHLLRHWDVPVGLTQKHGDGLASMAVGRGCAPVLDALLTQSSGRVLPDARNGEGWTLLHIAAHEGQVDIARYLLEHGADVNARGPYGLSPLAIATEAPLSSTAAMIDLLVRAGAALDAKSTQGWTPLGLSIKLGNAVAVTHLLRLGAAAHEQGPDGKDALALAHSEGQSEIEKLLTSERRPISDESSACPEGMLRVPTGTFWMGEEGAELPVGPRWEARISAFCIDRSEVTVASYVRCVQVGQCPPLSTTAHWQGLSDVDEREWGRLFCNADTAEQQSHPVNCVDWSAAKSYCQWAGGRLPTSAEWEYAARGNDGRRFPWGNEPDFYGVLLNRKGVGTEPVGMYPNGASFFGALDMAGNVSEWVADAPANVLGKLRVHRGGGWLSPTGWSAPSTGALLAEPETRAPEVGFRCAK